MPSLNKPNKWNWSFFRIIFLAAFLVFVGYHIFNDGNNFEDFEKGRGLYEKANSSILKNDLPSATNWLKESLELGFEPANLSLGSVYLQQHDYKKAKHFLVSALEVENAERFIPNYYGKANFDLGMVYYLERNGNIAYKYFKKAQDLGFVAANEYVKLLENRENRLPKG